MAFLATTSNATSTELIATSVITRNLSTTAFGKG